MTIHSLLIILFLNCIRFLGIIVPILLSVAFFTLFERKLIGFAQRRRGPNIVGLFGVLQPFADGLKLLMKEPIMPANSNSYLFMLAPVLTLLLSFIGWAVVPFQYNVVHSNLNMGILYIFAISSFSVYGIILAGWSSNSKYAFFGALRSAAQMISYEVSIGIIIMVVLIFSESLNLTNIILAQMKLWFWMPLFPLFILFLISGMAETNSAPFDLPEAEAELVSGYNVEYSSVGFAFFFIGEYANIMLMAALTVILFFGGWLSPLNILNFMPSSILFSIKVMFMICIFILIRVAYPSYRYDQLMSLGWKVFLPLSLGFFFFYASFAFFLGENNFIL